MKNSIYAVMITVSLFGCDQANKTVDSAQEAATEAAETVKETASDAMDSAKETASDMADAMTDTFDFDQFSSTSPQAKSFSDAIQGAMDVDFSDPQAVDSMTSRVANTYKCYMESTSEAEAQSTVSSILSSLSSGDVKSLIQTAIDNAKYIAKCVM